MGLVSLNDMKTYLNVSGTDYDTFLQTQIDIVSEAIENYCRRKFAQATYTQTFYSNDYPLSSVMELLIYPVISITSVIQDDVAITDYRLQKDIGRLISPTGWFVGEETVVIYSAGFATIPETIKSVVYSVVEERYNKKVSGVGLNFGSDVQRVSIPGTISIDFDYSLSNNERSTPFGLILGNHLNVLDFYRSDRAVLGQGTVTYVST